MGVAIAQANKGTLKGRGTERAKSNLLVLWFTPSPQYLPFPSAVHTTSTCCMHI